MATLPSPPEVEAGAPVMISALQHYLYCPRQCALIHLDQEFAENLHTARGNAVHAQVDIPEAELRGDVRIERALPLYSRTLGLTGKADVVELHGQTPYPVEYKNGPRRTRLADEVQLAAQAICLEEMTGQTVSEGALFHFRSRRRRVVTITPELREKVRETVEAIRSLLASLILPPPVNDSRCDKCSLYEICQPEVVAERGRVHALLESLYCPEEES